ncbi:hypothetical protein AMELA_G00173530 [Ameiurus melas]|uniref:C-type lectin domain-containing protein n=1 Tax=Ameiurus melas TaxID=219545 RepID=A0A7J6ADE0_AMEME|nr:hypothetical protein AMELA_G00173530 [Ameiurus melas]
MFCVSALGLLLLLSALMALCAVGILYHNKVVSFEILHEQYENATATLMMQENKAKEKEGMYEVLEVKYQELDFACNISQSRRCEEGWKSLGLKCYYFSTEKLNWMQSRDYCVGKGGHLVIINSQMEQNFAFSQIGETHWIGLNDLEAEGKWMWVNNQPLKEMDVKFWFTDGPNEPDNWKKEDPSGEDCAALGHEIGDINKWIDASCLKQKRFICEK